jgi:nucleoside-diphosphate-sugar epimerase
MTNVLILGGTGWVSGRLAQRWVEAGATVTCLARGTSPVPEGSRLLHADRNTPDAYHQAIGRTWDEVVDVSSDPAHVAAAIDALGPGAGHWTYVSSVSVYADVDVVGAGESAALAAPARSGDREDYPGAKAAAEAAVRAWGRRAAIVRPGLIVGPGDPTDRFGYWPARFAHATTEAVLVPRSSELNAQVIDVDDLVDFLVSAGMRGLDGPVNAVGDSTPLADVFALARAAAGHRGDVVPVPGEWLHDHDVAYWAGPRSLPLWLPPEMPGFATRNGDRYRAAGGRIRPLAETVARVLADERSRGVDRARASGLTREDERSLIRLWLG